MCHSRPVITTAALRYNRPMEQVSKTLQRIMAQALKRLPPENFRSRMGLCRRSAVAEKTRVLGCNLCDEKQTLVVEVPDANWRAQLYAMAPQFLARLNQFIRIERIEFKLAARRIAKPVDYRSRSGIELPCTRCEAATAKL